MRLLVLCLVEEMPCKHCIIPGCTWYFNKSAGEKRSMFSILKPELAKTQEVREHREKLKKILLSLRDSGRGDKIKEMLHKQR